MRQTSVKKRITASIIRHLRKWHRKLGILAAFFLIFLSITGIALNHTNYFSLAHQPITNAYLLSHYGIHPPSNVRFFNQKQFSVTEQLVWLNEKLLLESQTPIVGIGQYQQFYLIGNAGEVSFRF